jgi:hypothetical protein
MDEGEPMNIFTKQLLLRDRDGKPKPMAYYCGPNADLLNDFTGPPLPERKVSIEEFERDMREARRRKEAQ